MTSLDILNSIRLDMDAEYQARIPEATRENIQSVGNTLVGSNANTPYFNKFFTNLINRIGKVIVEKMEGVEEIFSALGKDIDLNMGDSIQKIFVDIPTAHAFDGTATTSMLSQERGVIHIEYTRIDRKLFYKQTLNVDEIREAFVSISALDDLVRAIIEAMTTSLGYDKYIMLIETLQRHVGYIHALRVDDAGNKVYELVVPEEVAYYDTTAHKIVWGTTGAKDFLKGLRVATRSLKFPHALDFDSYAFDEDEDEWALGGEKETITKVRTPLSRQVLALEVSSLAEVDVDALAVLFNISKAELSTKTIELEDGSLGLVYGSEDGYYCAGFVCDKEAVEKVVSLQESDSFKNPESRAVNYWLHFWGAMAVSKFKDFMPIVLVAKAGA